MRIGMQLSALMLALITPVAVVAATMVGKTEGQFRVTEQGQATYSFPLKLPEGTAGVKPELSLNYSSSGGEGPLGVGWSLSTGSVISRCPKTFATNGSISGIDLTINDRYCLDGQQLILRSGSYGVSGSVYHTEIESFSTIRAHGNSSNNGPRAFTVETKSGDVHYYGYVDSVSGDLAISLQTKTGVVDVGHDAYIEPSGYTSLSVARGYYLKATRDVSGNYILYTYNENNANAEVASIQYGGNSRLGKLPYASVDFSYISRDIESVNAGYFAGTFFRDDQQLTDITVSIDSDEYRTYHLNFNDITHAEDKLTLQSIEECVGADCYPATSFDWYLPAKASDGSQEVCDREPGMPVNCWQESVTSSVKPFSNTAVTTSAPVSNSNRWFSQAIDFNGDGYIDLIKLVSGAWKVSYGPEFSQTDNLTSTGVANKQNLLNIDYDGNGTRDLLVANSASSNWYIVSHEQWVDTYQVCEPGGGGIMFLVMPEVEFPTGGGSLICETFSVTRDIKVADIGRQAIGFNGKAQVLDIDGDGLEDIVYQTGGNIAWYRNTGGAFAPGATLTSLTNSNPSLVLNNDIEQSSVEMKNAASIDVNGDGRSDLIAKTTDTISECFINGTVADAQSRLECEGDLQGTWSTTTTTGYKL